MNALNNLFSNIKGDVQVNVSLDPGSIIMLTAFIILAIVLSQVFVKVIG